MGSFIFILGLIAGSFLNALIHRLRSGQSMINDRSRCVRCGHDLTPFDLIPVLSFIWLRGRCGYCKARISWQYPLIELLTATAFVLFYLKLGIGAELVFRLAFVCLFLAIAFFDLRHFLILDKVLLVGFLLAAIHIFWSGALIPGMIAGLIAGGFFGLQYLLSKGRWIGLGDVKFGFVLGLIAGYPLILPVLMSAYLSGSVVGIGLVLFGKKQLSSRLPFGTFLSLSAIINMLFSEELLRWYQDLINL